MNRIKRRTAGRRSKNNGHLFGHITNICMYCNLYREYWPKLPVCPGRKAWEAAQRKAERGWGITIEPLAGKLPKKKKTRE